MQSWKIYQRNLPFPIHSIALIIHLFKSTIHISSEGETTPASSSYSTSWTLSFSSYSSHLFIRNKGGHFGSCSPDTLFEPTCNQCLKKRWRYRSPWRVWHRARQHETECALWSRSEMDHTGRVWISLTCRFSHTPPDSLGSFPLWGQWWPVASPGSGHPAGCADDAVVEPQTPPLLTVAQCLPTHYQGWTSCGGSKRWMCHWCGPQSSPSPKGWTSRS